jgi:hypothetical protein
MELNGYRLLLPEGTLDYFDLVDVKESVNEVVIYLEEKNIVPEKYTDQDIESKGFYDPVIVQDFPLRGKKVFLNIRRRRWLKPRNEESAGKIKSRRITHGNKYIRKTMIECARWDTSKYWCFP